MKDYYSIIRVKRFASVAEVRRAYRKMVQQYHPDINPDPSAAAIIRNVNEAYEVLSDQQKKHEYDSQLTNPYPYAAETQPVHRDPRYRKGFRPVKKVNRQLELIKQYLHVTVKISWTGCIVCFLLLLDLMLPRHIMHDSVRALYSQTTGKIVTCYLVSEKGKQIKISYEDMIALEQDMSVDIIESSLTRTTLAIYFPEKNYRITNLATLYRNFAFVPILLLITSIPGVLMKNNPESKFNLGLISAFMLIFTIVLILK